MAKKEAGFRQIMRLSVKPGDLVKFGRPTSKCDGKYFLVLEVDGDAWVKINDGTRNLYHWEKDLVVVNSS